MKTITFNFSDNVSDDEIKEIEELLENILYRDDTLDCLTWYENDFCHPQLEFTMELEGQEISGIWVYVKHYFCSNCREEIKDLTKPCPVCEDEKLWFMDTP